MTSDNCFLDIHFSNFLKRKYSYPSSNVTMTCNSSKHNEPYQYKVHALSCGKSHQGFLEDVVCLMISILFAINLSNTCHQTFFSKPSRALNFGQSDSFPKVLHKSVTVTSVSVILEQHRDLLKDVIHHPRQLTTPNLLFYTFLE